MRPGLRLASRTLRSLLPSGPNATPPAPSPLPSTRLDGTNGHAADHGPGTIDSQSRLWGSTRLARHALGLPDRAGAGHALMMIGWPLHPLGFARVATHAPGSPDRVGAVVAALMAMGLSRVEATELVTRKPRLAAYNSMGLLGAKAEWLKRELGLSGPRFRKVVMWYPEVLIKSIQHNLAPKVALLRRMGYSKEQMNYMVWSCPSILGQDLESRIEELRKYLVSDIQVPSETFWKTLAKQPRMLSISIHSMQAKVAYILSLGVPAEKVGRLISRHPNVLCYSIEKTMRPSMGWFMAVGVHGDALGTIALQEPAVFGYSTETLSGKHEYLKELGIRDDELAVLYRKCPRLLGFALKGPLMQEKLDFVGQTLGLSVRDALARWPFVMGLSLERRLRPRSLFLKSGGFTITINNFATVYSVSDQKFDRQYSKLCQTSYLEFLDRQGRLQ
eukprot:evm.model.scf_562.6 EVM.evm.TU.scf_562.6   scf_562:75512-78045(-)